MSLYVVIIKFVNTKMYHYKTQKEENTMNNNDKARVKRMINNTNDLIKFSGLNHFTGQINSGWNKLTKDQKVKYIVYCGLINLTSIGFDSNKYNEDSYLNLRLIHLEERQDRKLMIWDEKNPDSEHINKISLYDKTDYCYEKFVTDAGITESEYRNMIDKLIKYVSSRI